MGAERKRMLFSRAEEEQTQRLVEVTDKCRVQRERGCYLVGQRAHTIILRGSVQPKKSESLNQVFSQLLTKNFKRKSFTRLLVI